MMLAILLSLFCGRAEAGRALMEGTTATANVIYVSTQSTRVHIATASYTGGLSSVGLFISSNVVISNTSSDNNVVLYATGSVVAGGVILSATGGLNKSTATIINTNIPNSSLTTAFGPCLAEVGTMTFTTANVPVDIILEFNIDPRGNNVETQLNVLVDGNFTGAFSSSLAFCAVGATSADSSNKGMCTRYYRTRASLSAGSHTFCVTSKLIGGGNTSLIACGTSPCGFEIREAR